MESLRICHWSALSFRVEEVCCWRSHAPPWSLPFIPGLMTGKPSLLKCGFHHSPGDENPKFDRRAAFGRHTLTSLPPTGVACLKSTNPTALEVEKKKKSNLAETDVWKLSIENGTRFGGRNMQEAVIWDGWGFDAGHSAVAASCLFWDQYTCTGQAGPATFCHWIYSAPQLNTFQ